MAFAALRWHESITVVLAGLVVAAGLHGISHTVDADPAVGLAFGAVTVLLVAALIARVAAHTQSNDSDDDESTSPPMA